MEIQASKELVAFVELRDAIRDGNHGIAEFFIASLPDHIFNETEDNFAEVDQAGNALLDEMARFAGQYIAQGCGIDGHDPNLRLEDFVSTLRMAFNQTMQVYPLEGLSATAEELGGY